ncbi:pectate lyase family protein [Siccirubricoccus phaeus]|uniref:glycosyl hydrolase family 28-related protein n=1 Tax=Siccirubricoccus phaeus TaxID=2595053 RepID=UPI0011F1999F|nr:glycosyl hydrolase family 28-related protein [Siccirubricoccus phaeus]
MPARIDDLLVLDAAVSKTDLAKYLRDREAVLPSDFGGLGDGVADDRAAIQAAFDRAAADQKFAVVPPGTWNVSAGVTLGGGARGLLMRGMIQYTGTAPATVLTLGDGGTVRNGEKLYAGLQVRRRTQSDWLSEADIGILARNLDASVLDLRLVEGFTIGLRTLGDGRGFEDTTLHLGRILNNKIGLDVHCATVTAWNTSVRYYGGHFACATGINPTVDRFGIRLGQAPGAYTNHNRHVFDAPNFELRQLDPNVAIPFLNETNGSAVIGRALRMEACSPIVARHTGAAQDCEYEVAWSNTYAVGIEYTATATRCGNAVLNRHRAPASRHLRLLGNVPNLRAAAFRHSAAEIGVEGLAAVATSTTSATTLAELSFNGLDGITPTARGLLLEATKGFAFVVDCSRAKEFALAHWLVGGADGGRIFVRCFDAGMAVREDVAGDVLASLSTMLWNAPSKAWTGGATMADSSLNRRMTVRLGPAVAVAQIGIVGLDGAIELEALRLYGLPENAPALLCGTPALPVGQREFAAEVAWDLPSLAPGATSLLDVTVTGSRQGDLTDAALAASTRFVELDTTAWSNNTVRVMARNISPTATFDLGPATLSVQVTKRRVP